MSATKQEISDKLERALQRLEAVERKNETLDEKYKKALLSNETLEAKCNDLTKDVAKLRGAGAAVRDVPKEEPFFRELPGRGWVDRGGNPVFPTTTTTRDRAGNEITLIGATVYKSVAQLQEENMEAYKASLRPSTNPDQPRASEFITRSDGTKVWAPDGVMRNADGSPMSISLPDPAPTGPRRSHAHQMAVELIDFGFPITPYRAPDDE